MAKKRFDISKWREQEFLSITEIGMVLSISYNTASQLAYSLPYVRIGDMIRVARPALEKWIRDQERSAGRMH